MKICFVGIGSIAKRHIRNLIEICDERKIDISIDAFRRTQVCEEGFPKCINKIYTSVQELPKDYDVIFLTNPTEYHADMLCSLQDNAKHFFIEKPVASLNTIEKLKKIEYKKDSLYYVACPLRYTGVIQYLKENIDVRKINAIRCISSSYLPDWRPGVDYRDTYSAHKELGGGVKIDLIHEWDYLTYLLGMPTSIKCYFGKVSDLEIDSEDYAVYIAQYGADFVAELHLDYFGRKTIRRVEVFTEDETIVGDLVSGKVEYLVSGKCIDLSENRDSFQKKELEYFLDAILLNKQVNNDINHAVKVLGLTQGIVD